MSEAKPIQAEATKARPKQSYWQRLRSPEFRETLSRALGLDLRSLALFRIALGVLVVSDAYHRALHLTAHYTDQGFMPRDKLVSGWSNPLFYSFHNWGGDVTSQTILFVVTAAFGLMLLVGFKTRVASIMTLLLVTSVQGRNYLILQGGDDLLRVMLFWSMFLPLGARFSIDAVLARREGPVPKVIFSAASLTLALQLLAMYSVSAALKTGPSWHGQGSAIFLALHHHAFATPFGIWFGRLPLPLLQYMTWSVYYLELIGPFLFFLPYKHSWARALQTLLFLGFHFGLFLTMELGHFPWVAMGAWLVMFPSWFWDKPIASLLARFDLRRRWVALSSATTKFVLAHRDWFGASEARPLRIAPSRVASVVVTVLALYTTYGTVFAAANKGNLEGDQFNPMMMLRLYANWGMFAPNPPTTSGWFVITGTRKDGIEVDVWNDVNPVSWAAPEVPSATYRSQRWRKFLDNITNSRHAVVRPYFLKWLCRDWNENHAPEDQIRSATLYQMAQTVEFPAGTYTPLKKNNLQRQSCPLVPGKPKDSAPKRK